MRNTNNAIGNRTCYLPVCSVVPQPTVFRNPFQTPFTVRNVRVSATWILLTLATCARSQDDVGQARCGHPWSTRLHGVASRVVATPDLHGYTAWPAALWPPMIYTTTRRRIIDEPSFRTGPSTSCIHFIHVVSKHDQKSGAYTCKDNALEAGKDCTGLFEMTVGVLTTCHTQYTWDSSM